MTVREAAEQLGVSRAYAYAEFHAQRWPHRRAGAKYIVDPHHIEAIRRLMERGPVASNPPAPPRTSVPNVLGIGEPPAAPRRERSASRRAGA